MEWINLCFPYAGTVTLDNLRTEIKEWMQENLNDDFVTEWEFGEGFDSATDGPKGWYLHIGLSPTDRIIFILKWC